MGAAVILDVACFAIGRRFDLGGGTAALEFLEYRRLGDSDHAYQHAQPAAMGHADLDSPGAGPTGQLDDPVQHRHQDVQTLDREALLAQVTAPEEPLESLDRGQPVEEPGLLVSGESNAVLPGLDGPPQPGALLVVVDVLDLIGDRAAVGRSKLAYDIRQGFPGQVDSTAVGRNAGKALRAQAPRHRIQGLVAGRPTAEWVEIGGPMTELSKRAHEVYSGRHLRQAGG